MYVNLTLGDDYVLLDPVVPEGVKKMLTFWERGLVIDPENGRKKVSGKHRAVYSCEQFAVNKETGELGDRLVTLPGFASRVAKKMGDLGYQLNWKDRRTTPPEPDVAKALGLLREYQKDAAFTLLMSNGGVCTCPTGFGKTYLMAALILAYSKEDLRARNTPLIVVVTPGKDLARKNYNSLCMILGRERDVGLITSDMNRESQEVQVVTPESLHHVPMDQAGIVIYDEVHTLSESRASSVVEAKRALKFGFSATPTGRFDGADTVVEGVFGPIVYTKTFSDAVLDGAICPIKVLWMPAPAPDRWREYHTRDSTYRHGVMRNKNFHEMVGDIWKNSFPAEWQSIGVADKLEHLHYMVPCVGEEVEFVHGTTTQKPLTQKGFSNLSPVSKKEREDVYDRLESGELKRVASTDIYRVGVDFPKLRVLLNLAGMKSEIITKQLTGRTSRLCPEDGKTYGYVIDFWHSWDVRSNKDGSSRPGWILSDDMARNKIYEEMGFESMFVEDPKQVRLV